MGNGGDITDAFDDDRLKKAIEQADSDGLWKDPAQEFVDPKIQSILEELSAPRPRLKHSKKRKKREQPLPPAAWQQAIVDGKNPQPVPVQDRRMQFPGGLAVDVFERDLRREANDLEPAPDSTTSPAMPEPETRPAPRRMPAVEPAGRSWWIDFGQTLLAALPVFVLAAAGQVMLTGWHPDLVPRTLGAGLLTTIVWLWFDVGRFSAPLTAVAIDVLLFATTHRIDEPDTQIAVGIGVMVTTLCAGVLGLSRENRNGSRGVRR